MRAVILAAGSGSRLEPYTAARPKAMLPFGGTTLLEAQVSLFRDAGVDEISVVLGHAPDSVPELGIRRFINPDYRTTHQVASLMAAREFFDGDLIVSYGDILFERRVLDLLLDTPGDLIVAADPDWRDYWRFRFGRDDLDTEEFRFDREGRITAIGRPDVAPSEMEARYIGLLLFSPEALRRLSGLYAGGNGRINGKPSSISQMTDLVSDLALSGLDTRVALVERGWLEFDTVDDYERILALEREGGLDRFIRPPVTPG